jgi:hypothetical protein
MFKRIALAILFLSLFAPAEATNWSQPPREPQQRPGAMIDVTPEAADKPLN